MQTDKKVQFYLNDPSHLAEGLLHNDFIFDAGGNEVKGQGAYTLRWWRDDYYFWENGRYVRLAENELKRVVVEHIKYLNEQVQDEEQQISITTQRINNILLCLSSEVRIPQETELDTWLSRNEGLYHTIPVNNSLLMLCHSWTEKPFLVNHTPNYFTLTKLLVDYDPEAKCPKFLEFLDDVMQGDQQYIRLLQQWCGYLFRPDLREQKFLLCSGEGANGKSVFFEVIEAVVGRDNCSHVPLPQFGSRFGLYDTLGKMVNITNESSHIIEDEAETILKSFVAGDTLSFERKFRDKVSAKPTAKLMIGTNARPRFGDKTGATFRRILLVPFDKVIPDEVQIKDLAEQLNTERSGILNWALEGLRDLAEIGRFVEPDKHKALLEQYRRDADPAREFLQDNYTFSRNECGTASGEVYEKYVEWCRKNGCREMSNPTFGQQVKRVFPDVERRKIGGRGQQQYIYTGLMPLTDEFIDE